MDDLIERLRQQGRWYVDNAYNLPLRAADRIAALEAELAVAQDYKDCGCSYDHPNDLCLGHEKLFKRLTDKRIAALEADKVRLMGLVKEAREALGAVQQTVEDAAYCVKVDTPKTPFTEALNQIHEMADATLAKIKESTDGRVTD